MLFGLDSSLFVITCTANSTSAAAAWHLQQQQRHQQVPPQRHLQQQQQQQQHQCGQQHQIVTLGCGGVVWKKILLAQLQTQLCVHCSTGTHTGRQASAHPAASTPPPNRRWCNGFSHTAHTWTCAFQKSWCKRHKATLLRLQQQHQVQRTARSLL